MFLISSCMLGGYVRFSCVSDSVILGLSCLTGFAASLFRLDLGCSFTCFTGSFSSLCLVQVVSQVCSLVYRLRLTGFAVLFRSFEKLSFSQNLENENGKLEKILVQIIRLPQVVFTGCAVSFASLGQVQFFQVLQVRSVVMLGLSCFTGFAVSFTSLGWTQVVLHVCSPVYRLSLTGLTVFVHKFWKIFVFTKLENENGKFKKYQFRLLLLLLLFVCCCCCCCCLLFFCFVVDRLFYRLCS